MGGWQIRCEDGRWMKLGQCGIQWRCRGISGAEQSVSPAIVLVLFSLAASILIVRMEGLRTRTKTAR
jgi:hypothetical protein